MSVQLFVKHEFNRHPHELMLGAAGTDGALQGRVRAMDGPSRSAHGCASTVPAMHHRSRPRAPKLKWVARSRASTIPAMHHRPRPRAPKPKVGVQNPPAFTPFQHCKKLKPHHHPGLTPCGTRPQNLQGVICTGAGLRGKSRQAGACRATLPAPKPN